MVASIPPKKVTNVDVGTADLVGGDDWDLLVDFLNDVDTTGPVKINTATRFRDQKIKKLNPAGTFTGTELNPPLTVDRDLDYGYSSQGNYVVYKDLGSLHYKVKGGRLNDVIWDTTVAEEAIQAALDTGGAYSTIIIRDTTYTLSAGFTGFIPYYNQKIIMGHGSRIQVPNGYTGKCWKVADDVTRNYVHFSGGMLEEQGTPAKLWTGFDFNSTTGTGITGLEVNNCRIVNAGVGIDFRTDTNGFVNACNIMNVTLDFDIIGVKFTHTGTFTDGQSGANTNRFYGGYHEYTSGVTHGFNNVNGRRNQFINCYPADFTGSAITMNISANAKYTDIDGGSCTFWNFTDASTTGSFIKDPYNPNIQCSPRTKKQGRYFGGSQTATFDGLWTSMGTVVGNAGAIARSIAGVRFQYNTGATINTLSGTRITAALLTERDLNPITHWKIALPGGVTTTRAFAGFTAATPVTGVDPLNGAAGVLFGYDSSVDANWHIYQNDGTGGSNSTTINNIAAADTAAHNFSLKADNANSKFQYSYANGTWTDINTDIPAATTGLGWAWWVECLASATARSMDVYWATTLQDG